MLPSTLSLNGMTPDDDAMLMTHVYMDGTVILCNLIAFAGQISKLLVRNFGEVFSILAKILIESKSQNRAKMGWNSLLAGIGKISHFNGFGS